MGRYPEDRMPQLATVDPVWLRCGSAEGSLLLSNPTITKLRAPRAPHPLHKDSGGASSRDPTYSDLHCDLGRWRERGYIFVMGTWCRLL